MKNYVFCRYVYSFIIISLVSVSCIRTSDQASRKINNLLERFPNAIDTSSKTITKIDTVFVHDTIEVVKLDTQSVKKTYYSMDSLMNLLKKKGCDTVFVEIIKDQLKKRATIENLMGNPILIDTLGVKGKVHAKGNAVIVDLVRTISEIKERSETKKTVVIKCPEQLFYKDKWFWISCALGVMLILSLLRR